MTTVQIEGPTERDAPALDGRIQHVLGAVVRWAERVQRRRIAEAPTAAAVLRVLCPRFAPRVARAMPEVMAEARKWRPDLFPREVP